jgi:hypothetical protein
MLFLLKIMLPPLLVGAMSLAARRWGPTVGGLLMGLPWMTGPVLFFLALDKGDDFAVGACTGIELGVACICAFMLAYGAVSTYARWPLSILAAFVAFAGAAWATQSIVLSLWGASALAAACLAVTALLLPRPKAMPVLSAPPRWDIPARMLATLLLVAGIMLCADLLGPQLSGIISTYPAILTVIGTFTHQQWGCDAVRRVLRGLALSLFAFVMFFLVVGKSLPALGLAGSFVVATLAALAISAGLMARNQRRLGRRSAAVAR